MIFLILSLLLFFQHGHTLRLISFRNQNVASTFESIDKLHIPLKMANKDFLSDNGGNPCRIKVVGVGGGGGILILILTKFE